MIERAGAHRGFGDRDVRDRRRVERPGIHAAPRRSCSLAASVTTASAVTRSAPSSRTSTRSTVPSGARSDHVRVGAHRADAVRREEVQHDVGRDAAGRRARPRGRSSDATAPPCRMPHGLRSVSASGISMRRGVDGVRAEPFGDRRQRLGRRLAGIEHERPVPLRRAVLGHEDRRREHAVDDERVGRAFVADLHRGHDARAALAEHARVDAERSDVRRARTVRAERFVDTTQPSGSAASPPHRPPTLSSIVSSAPPRTPPFGPRRCADAGAWPTSTRSVVRCLRPRASRRGRSATRRDRSVAEAGIGAPRRSDSSPGASQRRRRDDAGEARHP